MTKLAKRLPNLGCVLLRVDYQTLDLLCHHGLSVSEVDQLSQPRERPGL